ncbi:MAG: ATP-dependent metallopeptidase FtsH/Yme1/Tma family protein, partial [Alphaproteobacteria bacterium]
MNKFGKNMALWVIIGLLLVALFNLFQGSTDKPDSDQLAYSEFVQHVERREIKDVVIKGDSIEGHFTDGRKFSTRKPPDDPSLVKKLLENKVGVTAASNEREMSPLLSMLISWFPLLLIIGIWIFFMRQMQSGSGRAMGFGKSRARLMTERSVRVTFDDVAGIDEAKQELEEIIEFLRDPQKVQRLGGKIPKGVLLVGPPGTGK